MVNLSYESTDDLCILCQTNPQDTENEDGLCAYCYSLTDKYAEEESKINLAMRRKRKR